MKKDKETMDSAELDQLWTDMWKSALPVKNATLHGAVSVAGFATEKTINKDKLVGAKIRRDKDGNLLIVFRDVKAIIEQPNVACSILDL